VSQVKKKASLKVNVVSMPIDIAISSNLNFKPIFPASLRKKEV
jgi:hypothetical protein